MSNRSSIAPDAAPGGASAPSSGGGILGQRRLFLVNKRYQLRASLLTAGVVLVLLVFLNLTLYAVAMGSAERILVDAPELAAVIRAQDRVELSLIVLASFIYLVGVFLITVLETHRTAGAAHNLGERLGEIERGRYDVVLKLRKGDNLIELEGAFNGMSRALQQRTWDEIETLEQLARDAEKLGEPAEGRRVAERLHELAARKRSRVE